MNGQLTRTANGGKISFFVSINISYARQYPGLMYGAFPLLTSITLSMTKYLHADTAKAYWFNVYQFACALKRG